MAMAKMFLSQKRKQGTLRGVWQDGVEVFPWRGRRVVAIGNTEEPEGRLRGRGEAEAQRAEHGSISPSHVPSAARLAPEPGNLPTT